MTQFGGIWEKLAVVVAHEMLGFSARDYRIDGLVKSERLKRINELLSRLEHRESSIHSHHKPDWQQELAYILAGEGIDESVRVVCDVYMVNQQTGERWAFELKSPYPNSDITKVSKEKLLKLYSMDPPQVEGAFFALPYNPYGQRAKYNWSFPSRWFNMKTDLVVLMGDEFWDKIGGLGTYQAFIEAVNEIGKGYKDQIYRDYLGIEPPTRTQTETSQ